MGQAIGQVLPGLANGERTQRQTAAAQLDGLLGAAGHAHDQLRALIGHDRQRSERRGDAAARASDEDHARPALAVLHGERAALGRRGLTRRARQPR